MKEDLPWYVEELVEALEEEQVNVNEVDIEKTLHDLWFGVPHVMDFVRYVKLYLAWKPLFEKLDYSIGAFTSLVVGVTSEVSQMIDQDSEVDDATKERLKSYVPILEKLGLRILHRNLAYVIEIQMGAASLTLLGNHTSPGILLRSILEMELRAMLYQHLVDVKFRSTVEGEWSSNDSVAIFLYLANAEAIRQNVPLEDVLTTPEYCKIYSPKRDDMIFWLYRWNVFSGFKNVTEAIQKFYAERSRQIHGELTTLSIVRSTREINPKESITTMIELLDFLLVGVINTIMNLRPDHLRKLSEEAKIRESKKGAHWRDFVKYLEKGDLKYSLARLKELSFL